MPIERDPSIDAWQADRTAAISIAVPNQGEATKDSEASDAETPGIASAILEIVGAVFYAAGN